MSGATRKRLLGELEQLVLLATMRLGQCAYAVSIRDEIEARTGLSLSRSSVYLALDRLARDGYLTSWFGEPTPERGGKAKRFFGITPPGRRALAATEIALQSLRDSEHPARG